MERIETRPFTTVPILSLLLLACGSEAPPGSDDGDAGNSYFPLVDGAVSVYLHSSKGGWDETTTLTRTSSGVFREEYACCRRACCACRHY